MIKLIYLMLFMLSGTTLVAQNTVTGLVRDINEEPLVGVNIVIEGTTTGTVTDVNGNYSIDVPDINGTLVFSFVGYLAERINIQGRSNIDIVLIEDIAELDEVVVIGYGTMKKSDITGSIVSVDNEQITEVKTNNALESLQGKIAGADITRDNGRTDSDIDILIRGKRSLTATNDPLIIVDGIPFGDNIDINSEDIESIEILKDASSTAIYGSRGSNGVVLITTKRGIPGRSVVYFNSYYGVTDPYQKVPVFMRDSYIQAKIDANKDIYNWDVEPNPINVFPGDEYTGYLDSTINTDWQDIVTRTGLRQDYHLGVIGGTEKLSYNTSVDYYKEKGVVLADDFKRYTFRASLDGKVNKYINVGNSTILTYKVRDGRGPRFTDAVLLSPIVPAYDSLGNYIYQPNFANPRKSPLAYTIDEEEEKTTRIFSTLYGQVNILEGLTFKSNIGVDMEIFRKGYMYPQKAPNEGYNESGLEMRYNYEYVWTNILNFQHEFDAHMLNVMLGHEVQYERKEEYTVEGQEQLFTRSLWYNISTNKSPKASSLLEAKSLVSFFSRIYYIYNDKYIVNVSGRYDGASQLSEGNKWDFFPAASAAWRVSREEFMDNIEFISDLKLRLGYGVSGNAAVDPYSTAATLNKYPLYFQFGDPGSEVTYFGFRPDQLSSKDLKWERTRQVNLGVDFGFINNRIIGAVDLYHSNTDRLLLTERLPLSTGFFDIVTNAGETKTEGIEIAIQAVNISRGPLKWRTSLSFAAHKEEIVSLTSGVEKDEANKWFVGYPIDVHYDFEKIGIWQLSDSALAAQYSQAPGEIRVADNDHNDTITFDDRVVLGTTRPDWTGSLINTFNFYGFDLTINIYARMGQMVDADAYDFDPRMYDNHMEISYWTPENPTNDWPRLDAALAEMDYEHTLRYRDASFIKVKNITLGYNLPLTLTTKMSISKFRLYVSSNNPFILYTKLDKGIDPEREGSISWPLARTFIFGINVEF